MPQGKLPEGSVAISLFSMFYEIASVVSLPRNDIITQSQGSEMDLYRIGLFKDFMKEILLRRVDNLGHRDQKGGLLRVALLPTI